MGVFGFLKSNKANQQPAMPQQPTQLQGGPAAMPTSVVGTTRYLDADIPVADQSKQMKTEKREKLVKEQSTRIRSEDEAVDKFVGGMIDIKDIISPPAIEVDFNHMLIGVRFYRTLFATDYPKFVGANWLSSLINFEQPIDISTFYYPVDSRLVMQRLKRKIGEMEATLNLDVEARKVVDPRVKVALEDAKQLQESLAKGTEKFFHFALYVTINASSLAELEKIFKNLEQSLGAIGVIIKPATLQQEQGFQSVLPVGLDKLYYTRNMDTTSLATTFPFVSSNLTMNKGIMYGINKHNKSLVIFDRFQLENHNAVIFATSGAGKSYLVKLEALRGLMFGVESIIIDPEKEYEKLCKTIGGEYISFSQDGDKKLNPFELSGTWEEGEDELKMKLQFLRGLLKIMLGNQLSPQEEAVLDRALMLTYHEKGITFDPATHKNPPPLMEDLYKVLLSRSESEAQDLAVRLERYVKGSSAGIFDRKGNVDIRNTFTVFSVRDLSDDLRPIAMYMMLDFIWNRVKRDRRKRHLVIDEAWWMMQYEDAAKFIHQIVKRARKYWLGVTTITQDVEDFLDVDYGKSIISNSAIRILLKQSPAAVDRIQKVFYLSDGEKNLLLTFGIGEGIFFAGPSHVAIQVIASESEHNLITSDPEELAKQSKERMQAVTMMPSETQQSSETEIPQ